MYLASRIQILIDFLEQRPGIEVFSVIETKNVTMVAWDI
jgi:hypothetical protein